MTTQTLRRAPLAIAVLLVSALSLAACNKAPVPSLAQTKVPAGFTFQTTHSVAASIQAAASAAGPAGAPLEITLDGHELFRGHVMPERALSLRLALPTSGGNLSATLHGPNGATTLAGTVQNGQVSWQFQ